MKQKSEYQNDFEKGRESVRGPSADLIRQSIGTPTSKPLKGHYPPDLYARAGALAGRVSNLDRIAAARKGLHKSALQSLRETLEVTLADLEPILSVSKRSLQRYEAQGDKVLPKPLSDHILQIFKVYERALEVFGTREKALEWLKSPIPALGHQVPLSLLDTSAGVEVVMTEFVRIDHGIFA